MPMQVSLGGRAPAKSLQQKLQLLIDLCLGLFHGNKLVGEALLIGLDAALHGGDLVVDVRGLLGEQALVMDHGSIIAREAIDIGTEADSQPIGRIGEETLNIGEIVGQGVVESRAVGQAEGVIVAVRAVTQPSQLTDRAAQSRDRTINAAAQVRGDRANIPITRQHARGDVPLAVRIDGRLRADQ